MMFLCLIEDIYHAEIQKCLLVDARENKTATSEQKSPPFKRLVLKNDFALNRYLVSVTIKIYRSTGNFQLKQSTLNYSDLTGSVWSKGTKCHHRKNH